MDDAELQAIRKARLHEMQRNSGQPTINESTTSNSNSNLQISILSQILEPSARERLSRINMVNPQRAKVVENYLIKLQKFGQLNRKINESQLLDILNNLSKDKDVGSNNNQDKIVFERKNFNNSYAGIDDDDDDDFFD